MKVLNIIGIVLSIGLAFITYHYAEECSAARWEYIFSDLWDYGSSYSYNRAPDITMEGATISLGFMAFFGFLFSISIAKIKTTTAKVMSIIGLSVTAIFLLWDFAVLANPSSMSFDEVGLAFLIYAAVMLAFCIVNLIQAAKAENKVAAPVASVSAETEVA